ncbi:hypothetical protein SELMODRAFT_446628 [Selaginella moellendorffii]|uniref:ACT domain-containing protein n=1 Tax=Selaginella moellendorffii TaxID=88036 RepID=D8ST42_SELML|nr:uncharacterized protein LOC9659323 [Selaginella moellendorffii]EFJ12420.1 hypothetical protein SELMODRAFT_446628 [Selaginella moellendorffii]|eukprot:XP_002986563.1 uncharacterized protein LOC9659323 [Selaginella moellendorffii]
MPWFPDIANPAFCETLHLRKIILEKQHPNWSSSRPRVLEPGSAEFIAALAAGSNSRRILHIGCGLSTIALAAAARATGGCLECVDTDRQKQAVVARYVLDLGLSDYVDFFPDKPGSFVLDREGFDFVLFTGEPENYIDYFDSLRFTHAAIIVAYNALDDATNEYIKHVRQQPGVDSSTLPVGRGIEVSKILSWESFRAGRKTYCELLDDDFSSPAATLTRFDVVGAAADLSDSVYESVAPPWDVDVNSRSSCLEEQDAGTVSPTLSIGTSLEEESARIHDAVVDSGGAESVGIHFQNVGKQTEIKVEGPDRHMLLADIILALNEAGVSVQGAKISTQDSRVEDVFYVVEEGTGGVLDMDQQEFVRSKILKKISQRGE